MNRSKLFSILLLLAVTISLTGCGKNVEEPMLQPPEGPSFEGTQSMEALQPPEGETPPNREPGFGPFHGESGKPDFAQGDRPGNTYEETVLITERIDPEEQFSKRDRNSTPDLSKAVFFEAKNDATETITEAGTYVLTGAAENYTIVIEAGEDKVQIVLQDVSITNDHAPVILAHSADKCVVTVTGTCSMAVKDSFSCEIDPKADAVIFSRCDLTLNGDGFLKLASPKNGISCKDDLKFTGGNYEINTVSHAMEANDSISVLDGIFRIESQKDGLHCKNAEGEGSIYICGGNFTILAASDGIDAASTLILDGGMFTINAKEGLEATYIQINDGWFDITASDDGINASRTSDSVSVVVEINGGTISVTAGPGDTDCIDSNGSIYVNGGVIDVTGNSTFDYEWDAVYNGGTILVNGQQTDSIPVSMMGGHGGFRQGDMGRGDRPNGFGKGPFAS